MDYQVKIVKKYLEGWATVLLSLKPILLWEQSWHPVAIVGGISAFYLTLYYLDLNTVTTIAMLGLLFNLLDFLLPLITKTVYGPNFWNGQMERGFEDMCNSLVRNYNYFQSMMQSFYQKREKQPLVYYSITCSSLLALVWLSASVGNTFLFFMFTTVVMLWPGLQKNAAYSLLTTKESLKSD